MSKKFSSGGTDGIETIENLALVGGSGANSAEFEVSGGASTTELDSTAGTIVFGFQNASSLVCFGWTQSANGLLSEVDIAFDNSFNQTGAVTVEVYEQGANPAEPADPSTPIAVSTNNFPFDGTNNPGGNTNFFTATFNPTTLTGGQRYFACIKTTANIFFGHLSGVNNAEPTYVTGTVEPTGGSGWNESTFDDGYVQVRTSTAPTEGLVLASDLYLSLPPLEKEYHTVPAGTYPLANDECLYVEINRAASSNTNLMVQTGPINTVVPSKNLVIFCRRINDVMYFGYPAVQRIGQNQTILVGGSAFS